MTDIDKTVPVWVDNEGVKTQVGWATPDNGTGVRKINLLDGFDNTALKNVHFGDVDPFETELDPVETQEPPRTYEEFVSEPFVEISGEVIDEPIDENPSGVEVVNYDPEVDYAADVVVEDAPEEAPLPAEPIEDAPVEELAAEPVDAGVAPEDSEPVVEATIEEDLPYIHDEDLENVDDFDSEETEDLPEGFEPAPAVQDEPEQSEDPAQP